MKRKERKHKNQFTYSNYVIAKVWQRAKKKRSKKAFRTNEENKIKRECIYNSKWLSANELTQSTWSTMNGMNRKQKEKPNFPNENKTFKIWKRQSVMENIVYFVVITLIVVCTCVYRGIIGLNARKVLETNEKLIFFYFYLCTKLFGARYQCNNLPNPYPYASDRHTNTRATSF